VTPKSPSRDVVERRLAHQRDLLAELRKLQPITATRLRAEPLTRAAVERMVQAIVDLALDINSHIVSSLLDRSPSNGRESFDLLVTAHVLDAPLADRLKPAVGLRNVLVHLYADIDVTVLADSMNEFEVVFSQYVRLMARWLLADGVPTGEAPT
jgi:uncharacterized protein YutE (UPF0331/DUF86 family)